MTIAEEEVEAGAKAACEAAYRGTIFGSLTEDAKKSWREIARACLTAAAKVRESEEAKSDQFPWATEYGKDLLTDLNRLAHARGTDSVRRDAFQRAFSAINKLEAKVRESGGVGVADLARIKVRIDYRLENVLCEMKPDFDDSITGFNEAWDTVRKFFNEEIARLASAPPPPSGRPLSEEQIRAIAHRHCLCSYSGDTTIMQNHTNSCDDVSAAIREAISLSPETDQRRSPNLPIPPQEGS